MNASLALKTCEHCGRENDQGATICIGCGFSSLKPLITIIPAVQLFSMGGGASPTRAPEFDQCRNVIASERGLAETSHAREIKFIPRNDITDLSLFYGSAADQPILQTILGSLLALGGTFGLWTLISKRIWSYDLALIGLGILGLLLLLNACRNHYFLRVTTTSAQFKIKFDPAASGEEIETFCKLLVDRWHYHVTD